MQNNTDEGGCCGEVYMYMEMEEDGFASGE